MANAMFTVRTYIFWEKWFLYFGTRLKNAHEIIIEYLYNKKFPKLVSN